MRKGFEIGGFIAAAVLIAFGIGAIVHGSERAQHGEQHAVAGADRGHART